MEKKFEIGNRVRMKRTVCFDYITFEKGGVGEVSSGENNKGFCRIRMKNAENGEMTEHFICACNLEPLDSKTAFLSELKELLEKYNAKMSADVSGPDLDCAEVDMLFLIGDDEIRFDVSMFDSFITPDNIIESACYDKE